MHKNPVSFLCKGDFNLQIKNGSITSLKYQNDVYDTEYIEPEMDFGNVWITHKREDSAWKQINTGDLSDTAVHPFSIMDDILPEGNACVQQHIHVQDLDVRISYSLDKDALYYGINIQNNSGVPIEIGDIAIPFPMNSNFQWEKKTGEKVLRHSYISGSNSYIFWVPSSCKGPYLMMTPLGNAKLEYYDMHTPESADNRKPAPVYRAYIHARAQEAIAKVQGCQWRQPVTGIHLSPQGNKDDIITYTFKFQWAWDYDDVRERLVQEGLIDIQVVPGMTVPIDQSAMFYLKTRHPINSITPEFENETELCYLGEKEQNRHLYQVKFFRLGENFIRIKTALEKETILEFFVTEALETLIKKRAAFLARSQHRREDKWYNGLISEWNMESKTLLGPDNYDKIKGWRIYEVTCDDPGLCKPVFLADKNVEYPVLEEVEALDYYIHHFVWGGLQRTEQEEYAYGIYGIPDWWTNRNSEDKGPKGNLHLWRIYDYPHLILLYWSMYRIAKNHSWIHMELPKETYLQRAYGTALAMFTLPVELDEWSAYKTGLYNELVIVDMIQEMVEIGWNEKAYRIQRHWEKKVDFFINQKPDLFGSEYPFDSTGFESTHAIAKYALATSLKGVLEEKPKHGLSPVYYPDALRFMKKQIDSNIFCRGWLEPAYYLLGSDYRGCGNAAYTLSYMSQMGGWAILDYALYYAEDPIPYLRLGYASLLSSWALVNSGTAKSNYGYWYPGEENDGGAGGGFEPAPFGVTWLEQEHHRGSWYYACEIDLGFSGFLRGGAVILTEDPIFGLFCYGGVYHQVEEGYEITMGDGIRRRFHVITPNQRVHMLLDSGHILSEVPLYINRDLTLIRFHIEGNPHASQRHTIRISGLVPGAYSLTCDDVELGRMDGTALECFTVLIQPTQSIICIQKIDDMI